MDSDSNRIGNELGRKLASHTLKDRTKQTDNVSFTRLKQVFSSKKIRFLKLKLKTKKQNSRFVSDEGFSKDYHIQSKRKYNYNPQSIQDKQYLEH